MSIEGIVSAPLDQAGAHISVSGAPTCGRSQLLQLAIFQVLTVSPPKAPFSDVSGMSGQLYRHAINRLVGWLGPVRYLEIGAWKGSTLLSAMWGNTASAVVIDNWSEFGGPREEFDRNVLRLSNSEDVKVLAVDWRTVDFASLGEFDVFLCDGPHDFEQQRDTAIAGLAQLGPNGIFVVDDWNWNYVREATVDALETAGRRIEYAVEVRTTLDNSHPATRMEGSRWHNGYLLATLD